MGRCIILGFVVLLSTFATIYGRVLSNADECPLPLTSVPTCPLNDPAFSLFFPHPSDCHWFFHCSNGVAYCKKCPADLHWNKIKRTCDYAYRAGCNANTSTFTTSQDVPKQQPSSPATTPAATAVSTELPAVAADVTTKCPDGPLPECIDQGHFVFFPHPSDCHWFFHCSNGVPYCKECPADLHWNEIKRTCDYAYRAGCNANTSTFTTSQDVPKQQPSSPATIPAATAVSTKLPAVAAEVTKCPDGPLPECIDQGHFVFFPHPSDCHWFFHCSNGVPYCKKCPADLHWNEIKRTCDYAYRAGCNANTSTFTTSQDVPKQQPSSPATTPAATAVSTELPAVAAEVTKCPEGPVPECNYPDEGYSVLFPHPNDIHWFFHCSNGVAYCKKCPADLHWDVKLETCVLPTELGALIEVLVPYLQQVKQQNRLHLRQPLL